MNHNHFESIQMIQKLAYLLTREDFDAVDVSIHPPFTDLRSLQTLIDADSLRLLLGAQNCYWQDKGAFTGEISPVFLSKLNVSYVICGHSERRELFGETDQDVHNKIIAIQEHGMTPILCVGETLAERESGSTITKVLGQLRVALAKRSSEQMKSTVIAYEPIWAIGTGRIATAGDAQAVIGAIRAEVAVLGGRQVAQAIRIQYGGSVNSANIPEIMAQPDIDGALVGGASLDPSEFGRIVQYRLRS